MQYSDLILIAAAYFLGSVPTGVLVAKAMGGADPRTGGSGNIGSTNVNRTLGKKAGIITLIGDMLKGAVPVLAAVVLADGVLVITLVALAAFSGHLFSVFLGFQGGKGVATACGVMFVISPLSALLSLLVFVAVAWITRVVSLASMLAAFSMVGFIWFVAKEPGFVPLAILIFLLIVFKHRENIKRLADGTENRITK